MIQAQDGNLMFIKEMLPLNVPSGEQERTSFGRDLLKQK